MGGKQTGAMRRKERSLTQNKNLVPVVLYYTSAFPIICCSVAKSRLTLCNPMDRSTPGFPVFHCLPEFAQIQVHWVGDAIQPLHPLSPPSPLPSVFPSVKVFSSELALRIKWPKYWSFSPPNEYSGLISLGLTSLISLLSKRLSRLKTLKTNYFSGESLPGSKLVLTHMKAETGEG